METLEIFLKGVEVAKKFLTLKTSLEGKTQSQLIELTCHKEAKAKHGSVADFREHVQ